MPLIHCLKRCNCGADSFILPGIFRAAASGLIAFIRSFSWFVEDFSFKNIVNAVLEALPRRFVPGVILTLYLLNETAAISFNLLNDSLSGLITCNFAMHYMEQRQEEQREVHLLQLGSQ